MVRRTSYQILPVPPRLDQHLRLRVPHCLNFPLFLAVSPRHNAHYRRFPAVCRLFLVLRVLHQQAHLISEGFRQNPRQHLREYPPHENPRLCLRGRPRPPLPLHPPLHRRLVRCLLRHHYQHARAVLCQVQRQAQRQIHPDMFRPHLCPRPPLHPRPLHARPVALRLSRPAKHQVLMRRARPRRWILIKPIAGIPRLLGRMARLASWHLPQALTT